MGSLLFSDSIITIFSMAAQSFTINGNLVGIYVLIINCTIFTQTSLLLLRYLTLFLEKNKLTLNRLLLEHSHLTHSYLINKDPAPTCEHYKCVLTIENCKCVLTIKHILCTCTKYEHNRKQYFPNSQLSHILLHSPKRNIFNYITDINLLTKLYVFNGTVLKVSLNPNQSINHC